MSLSSSSSKQQQQEQRPEVRGIFHEGTSTMTYVVSDPCTKETMILDSVLDYDASSGRTSNVHGEVVAGYCAEKGLDVRYIFESHVHADHLTGAKFLKEKYPDARTGIGSRVVEVQRTFSEIFNLDPVSDLFATDGSQFDLLFEDGDTFHLGTLDGRVLHTPGHTPACVSYVIGNDDDDIAAVVVFAGDTIFMPDFGTARCDFPGGSSADLYASVRRLYRELHDDTRVFVGHDYMPGGRELSFETTIGEEKRSNGQLNEETSGEEFARWRSERDGKLGMPKLIVPAMQVNLRGGEMPRPESNGVSYLKIPINLLGGGRGAKK